MSDCPCSGNSSVGVIWPTSMPGVTDVLMYFISPAANWNVTATGHRSADDFIVHPNLGLNSRPPKIARPGEVDTAVTRLQCRDLQGRFIEATWTCATRQQKSDKQKGPRPDFRPHYAPSRYWKAPSYKSTTNNERLAIASLFPRPTTLS